MDKIGEGGRGAKKSEKPQKTYSCDVESRGYSGKGRKKRRQESVGSVSVAL